MGMGRHARNTERPTHDARNCFQSLAAAEAHGVATCLRLILCLVGHHAICSASQGAVRAVIAQRRLAVMVEQIQAGKLEPKSLIKTDDDGIRYILASLVPDEHESMSSGAVS